MTREGAIERLEYMANELNDKVFGATDCAVLNIAIDELKHSVTINRVLEIIDKTRFVEETGELTAAWNDACENIKRQVLALKGEQDGFNLERRC